MTIDLNAAGAILLEQGFPGIVIAGLIWLLLEQRKELKVKDDKIEAIQEKRIAEGREGLTVASNATNVLEDVLKAVETLANNRAA